MKMIIAYINAEGEEVEEELPAKHEVCHRCEGHGTHLTPSIGEHAYSAEEFEESFSEPEDREQYFRRGGIYDVVCELCKGDRVLKVIDYDASLSSEQKTFLEGYQAYLEEERQYQREVEAERRYGC